VAFFFYSKKEGQWLDWRITDQVASRKPSDIQRRVITQSGVLTISDLPLQIRYVACLVSVVDPYFCERSS